MLFEFNLNMRFLLLTIYLLAFQAMMVAPVPQSELGLQGQNH